MDKSSVEDQEESCRERQEQEVEVLQSIYGGAPDFQDLRQEDVWKISRPPEFILQLRPNHDSRGQLTDNVCARLHVKISSGYPTTPPTSVQILREGAQGLSDEQISELNVRLCSLLPTLAVGGEVMILDLAQHVAQWLADAVRDKGPR